MNLSAAVTEYRAAQAALDDAKDAVTNSQERRRAARETLTVEIVDAARAGTRMRDLVAETGLSREWIRTLLRKNGVHPEA